MKFSIIIPTFHRNAELAECLRRLTPEAQGVAATDYEVIVSDDGRTEQGNVKDRGNLLAKAWAAGGRRSTAEAMMREQFPWARWVQGPRRGPAANRNNGARFATGEWLAFTDDDCLPEPGWLAAYIAASDMRTVLEGKTIACGKRDRLDMEAPVNETGGYLWSCNIAVKRTAYEAVGGFDEGYSAAMEDTDLHERLKAAGHLIRFLPAALVRHPWRSRRGLAFGRMHAESFARFISIHSAQRARLNFRSLLLDQGRRTLKDTFLALKEYRGRGLARQVALDLHWNWCLWLAWAAQKHRVNTVAR